MFACSLLLYPYSLRVSFACCLLAFLAIKLFRSLCLPLYLDVVSYTFTHSLFLTRRLRLTMRSGVCFLMADVTSLLVFFCCVMAAVSFAYFPASDVLLFVASWPMLSAYFPAWGALLFVPSWPMLRLQFFWYEIFYFLPFFLAFGLQIYIGVRCRCCFITDVGFYIFCRIRCLFNA